MREVPAVPHCCGFPGQRRGLGRQRCQQPPTGTAGQRPRPERGGGSGRRLIGRSAGPRARCRGRRRGRRGGCPQNGRQSRLLRGGCGRRRGRGGGRGEASPGGSRSILPPVDVDGAARDPGGLLSLPPPSALKRRGAGASRSRVRRGK